MEHQTDTAIRAGGAQPSWKDVPAAIRDKLIDSLQMGIAVYRSLNGYVSVLACNEYMRTNFGSPERPFEQYEEADMRSFVYEEDWHHTMEVRSILTTGRGASESRIYRLMPRGGEPKWYYVRGSSYLMEDGAYVFYMLYSDVDERQRMIEEFDRSMDVMLKSNPHSLCSARMNLTGNVCLDKHGMTRFSSHLLEAETVDEWCAAVNAIIPDQLDLDKIRRTFSREQMIADFEKGRRQFDVIYLRLTAEGRPAWRRTYFQLLRNPTTSDVEAVIYTLDYADEHRAQRIFRLLAEDDYSSLGTIDGSTGKMSLVLNAQPFFAGRTIRVLADAVQTVLDQLQTEEEREDFARKVNLPALHETLKFTDVVSINFTVEGRITNLTFRYLDERHDEIMFASRDVTDIGLGQLEIEKKLRRALDQAKEATALRTEFLGNISHDMRTPLNAILGYSMLTKSVPGIPEQAVDYVDKIERAGQTMLTLVKDTLDLQRLEQGTMELHPIRFTCREMMEKLNAVVHPQIHDKYLAFTADISRTKGCAVFADQDRMLQILLNLLSNAIKFTPERGVIALTIECLSEKDGVLHEKFSVRDNGIGMSEEFLSHVFVPYMKAPSSETETGAGLGLPITKKIVELMGGRIECRSRESDGTVVDVYLDLEKAPEEAESAAPAAAGALSGLHILLCEDNLMNAEIATAVLEAQGATVETAYDGQEEVDRFLSAAPGTYDVIITDIRMPVMDGFEAARRIRASGHADAAAIPIIAISSDAYASDVQKAHESGMNLHLPKPLDPKQATEEIVRLVRR